MDANQKRSELKFVLPGESASGVWSAVAAQMEADRGAVGGYPVVSEYFDSTDRHSYWQRELGVPSRRRMRLRVYGSPGCGEAPSAFLEIKQKVDGVTVKRRVSLALSEMDKVAAGELPEEGPAASVEESRTLSEATELFRGEGVRPVLQTRYRRHAFDSGPEGTLRITIDKDPCCRLAGSPLRPDDPGIDQPLVEEGAAIMEVKTSAAVPVWLRAMVGDFRLVPMRFSKYATGLDLYEFRNYTLSSSVPEPVMRF